MDVIVYLWKQKGGEHFFYYYFWCEENISPENLPHVFNKYTIISIKLQKQTEFNNFNLKKKHLKSVVFTDGN